PADLTPNWVIHTSPDNVAGAYRTARAMFEAMGGSGEIFIINGMMGNTAAIDRRAGLERALAAFPGITVVREDTGNWQTPEALRLSETWLPLHPNLGGIWTANDSMALGAVQALQARGQAGRVHVVGFDGTTPVIEQIRDGNILATVSANGYLQSGFTLAILYSVWAGLLNPARFPADFREFATPTGFITSANAAEFLAGPPRFDFTRPFFYGRDN
ncbi:MAG: sugar ABC transporter substrate-binding protein, partial [Treponema sp.]|nr:sugar ABC transporter substrate-binding protein [Treponema sp.]